MLRWLTLDDLRPFDVILTRPMFATSSKLIAAVGRGPYSHAALVVDPITRFESVARGVGFSVVERVLVGRRGGRRHLIEDVSRYARLKVLRHPRFAQMVPAGLQNAQQWLLSQAGALNCLAYPPWSAFQQIVAASALPDVVTQLLGRLPGPSAFDGPFCSELVAALFAAYGLPLFSGVGHQAVHPSDLAETVLEEVQCVHWGPPRRGICDLRAVREARRIAAIPGAALDGYAERQEMFQNLGELLLLFLQEAKATGLPAHLVQQGRQSITTAVAGVRQYETAIMANGITAVDALQSSLQTLPTFPWNPSPRRARADWLRAQPPASSLLAPIRQYLDVQSPGWEQQLVARVPPPYSSVRKLAISFARRYTPSWLPYLQ